MNIKEIIGKVTSGEALTDEETSFLASYEEPQATQTSQEDIDKAIKSRLAREQKKHDEEKAALAERLAELEEQNEDANTNTSELEKLQKKLERTEKKLNDQTAAAQEKAQALIQTQRESALNGLKAKLPLTSKADQEFINFKLNQMTADMDIDEISDSIDSLKSEFIESHPQFIRAEGSGSGIAPTNSDGARPTKLTIEQANAMSGAELAANKEAALKAAMGIE